jgi:hypothetical protein
VSYLKSAHNDALTGLSTSRTTACKNERNASGAGLPSCLRRAKTGLPDVTASSALSMYRLLAPLPTGQMQARARKPRPRPSPICSSTSATASLPDGGYCRRRAPSFAPTPGAAWHQHRRRHFVALRSKSSSSASRRRESHRVDSRRKQTILQNDCSIAVEWHTMSTESLVAYPQSRVPSYIGSASARALLGNA